jgi:hypothetical protein
VVGFLCRPIKSGGFLTSIPVSIIVIVLGLIVLVFGNRLALLGAGVGALLGIGILGLLPGDQTSWLWLVIPIGLAILFALGAGLAKAFISLISLALGALAGGAIVLAVLGLFGLDFGLVSWLLALIGAVIGAGFLARFKDWTVIVLAGLVGALLCVRGLQMLLPSLPEFLATVIGIVLAGLGIAYQGGYFGKRKSTG